MHITLSAGQAVTLHGWMTPRKTLRWSDVVEKEGITYAKCRSCNLTLKQLYQLQPDISEWVRYGGVGIQNITEMYELWSVHPIRDMHADLADILAMKWGSETLRKMGVTYDDLCGVGMSPETMRMFGFSLLGWINLGLKPGHLAKFSDAQVYTLFALTRQAAERCFLQSD